MSDETTITPAATTTVAVTEAGDGTTTVVVTPAHEQAETLRVLEFFPEHVPRQNDKHYPLFEAARKRLADAGRLICWRCGSTDHPELHHTLCEYALQNGVDVTRFEELYPEFGIKDDEDFFRWVEQDEHNLTVLCVKCHRGVEGIHLLPYPTWIAGRYWRKDLPTPGQITGGAAGSAATGEG